MPKILLALLVAVVATATVVVGVLLNRSPDESDQDQQPYESTPLADYDTDGVAVPRDSFCESLAAEAVAQAVGSEPGSSTSYGNGERARLDEGLRDVAHEFGCRWSAPGATARAWVFAPPVTPRSAREVARAAREEPGCEPVSDAPDYGKPAAAMVCDLGTRVEVSYRGLFGDAWLTCTLSSGSGTPRAEVVDRAGRWCVAVVEAARGDA